MESKRLYRNMPKEVFKTLAGYHANKKHLWNSRGMNLAPQEVKELISIQKITDELYPEFNYLFKKH